MIKITDTDTIYKFYKENYDHEILVPSKDAITNSDYYGLYEKGQLISLVNFQVHYGRIAEINQFVIHKNFRGKGFGKKTYNELESYFKESKVKKIMGWILADNFTSLFGALKLGYLIEGLARDNLPNTNVYLLGKYLGE